ncbi:hypothetical protein KSP39_PZI016426 [Platanthera zijinensis]|uniref:Uncharacterized protein n=1 Tax=Platanthera zijinensis TaxID=2320716 RepID=A0AAP0G0B1_9ASPA
MHIWVPFRQKIPSSARISAAFEGFVGKGALIPHPTPSTFFFIITHLLPHIRLSSTRTHCHFCSSRWRYIVRYLRTEAYTPSNPSASASAYNQGLSFLFCIPPPPLAIEANT